MLGLTVSKFGLQGMVTENPSPVTTVGVHPKLAAWAFVDVITIAAAARPTVKVADLKAFLIVFAPLTIGYGAETRVTLPRRQSFLSPSAHAVEAPGLTPSVPQKIIRS